MSSSPFEYLRLERDDPWRYKKTLLIGIIDALVSLWSEHEYFHGHGPAQPIDFDCFGWNLSQRFLELCIERAKRIKTPIQQNMMNSGPPISMPLPRGNQTLLTSRYSLISLFRFANHLASRFDGKGIRKWWRKSGSVIGPRCCCGYCRTLLQQSHTFLSSA